MGLDMELKKIKINLEDYPNELHWLLKDAMVYDSSSSPQAKVLFVDKGAGYFIKRAEKNSLKREFDMTEYFYKIGLSSKVLYYISEENDFMVTEKIKGDDCISLQYLNQPERLCDTLAECLLQLHSLDFSDCPIQNHTQLYLARAEENYRTGNYDKSHFPDSFGYTCEKEAWEYIEKFKHLLKTDTILHGDYCLPNIILDNWKFSGFIDLDNAGIGDKHVDIFWAIWSLKFNLKTNKYTERFLKEYGYDKVDPDILKLIAAIEVFG